MGWNKGLEALMNTEGADADEKGGDNRGVDFSFGKKMPFTQDDVKDILSGEQFTKMVKSGLLEEPIALVYKWGYYLTMEGSSSKWAIKATADFIGEKRGTTSSLGTKMRWIRKW